MPRSVSVTPTRPATRGYTPRPGFLSIPTNKLPTTANRAYTLKTERGTIVGFSNPDKITLEQRAALARQRRERTLYNIVSVLFAVLIGIVVDVAFGSPFLKSIGIGKGSVSPFVSSVRPFIPSVSSISSNAVRPSL